MLHCRIRPQNAQEKIDQSSVVTFCPPEEPQVVFGDKKVFTFDFVFDVETMQPTFYNVAVQKLIKGYVIYMHTPVVCVCIFISVCVCVLVYQSLSVCTSLFVKGNVCGCMHICTYSMYCTCMCLFTGKV